MDGASPPEAERSAPRRRRSRAAGEVWRKDPEGRRGRVLDAAARLFGEHGYAGVSTSQIAAAAGVAEGSVFHYFSSKQGVLQSLGERYGAEFAAAMFGGVDPAAGPAAIRGGVDPAAGPEAIRAVIERAFAFVAASYPSFGLFLLSDDSSHPAAARLANRLAVTRAIAAVLEAWRRAGAIRKLDCEVTAVLLFGLVEAALRACFAHEHGAHRERYVEATVAAVTRILEPAAARQVRGSARSS
ncbi:MAG: TetR/AcrR family transcriptional regulator [Deltaproteobacteria bacterium]|nr:TetR/AcrR family transcriptional regulator [Deltaproteobacteria bacterium]